MSCTGRGKGIRARIADAIARAIHALPILADGVIISVRQRAADTRVVVEACRPDASIQRYRVVISKIRGIGQKEE